MNRRARLIDKEVDGTITEAEQVELERLQSEMLAHRHRVAPLPIDELRALHQRLLNIHDEG